MLTARLNNLKEITSYPFMIVNLLMSLLKKSWCYRERLVFVCVFVCLCVCMCCYLCYSFAKEKRCTNFWTGSVFYKLPTYECFTCGMLVCLCFSVLKFVLKRHH